MIPFLSFSYSPDVDGASVLVGAEQDLRRPVPQGDDLVRVHADGDAEGARQAEVGDLDGAVLVDQKILGLQIPEEKEGGGEGKKGTLAK